MKPLVVIRRIAQVFAFGLFFYILYFTTYPLKGRLPANFLFTSDPLVMIITSISERVILAGIVVSLGFCFSALVFGRFFCGWLCPLGAIFDFSRLFYPGRKKGAGRLPARLTVVKFGILGFLFLLAFFGLQAAWLFDPLVMTARFLSLVVIPLIAYCVNEFFIVTIRTFSLYGGFYDFYHTLKESLLGINVYYFSHSLVVFLFTALFIFSSVAFARLWCRLLCPLGAGYGLLARWTPLKRRVNSACNHCNICTRRCRMEAIKEGGAEYRKEECILCMDCVYDCPQKAVSFSFIPARRNFIEDSGGPRVSRRQFLFLALTGFFSFGAKYREKEASSRRSVIRPPAALNEAEFLDRCIRCSNCMKVCITNGLQPCLFESGIEGIWTPRLVPEIGYCEYRCTLCGKVCPTGALKPLTEKEKAKVKIGTAVIEKSICLPWAEKKECIVCEEHCPTSDKAIKLRRDSMNAPSKPYVDRELCVGCGICQTKCPVRPKRAIYVDPL